MKLLEKRTIDSTKSNERKKEIDTGLALARKVDLLRETRITEEENLKKYRVTALAQIQYEINQFIETKINLGKECADLRNLRTELLKPLDGDWQKLNLAKKEFNDSLDKFKEKENSLKEDKQRTEKDKNRALLLLAKNIQNEEISRKNKIEIESAKRETVGEYHQARREREEQKQVHERKMSELQQLQTSYEVGIVTNENKEKLLQEEKSELIIREKELERQTRNLKIIAEAMEK